MFEIKVTTKDGKPHEDVRCGADACEIGSSRDNIVRLRGWKVAPRHMRLEKELAGVFAVDVSRGYGISVNGKKTERHGPLQPEDVDPFDFRDAIKNNYSKTYFENDLL